MVQHWGSSEFIKLNESSEEFKITACKSMSMRVYLGDHKRVELLLHASIQRSVQNL